MIVPFFKKTTTDGINKLDNQLGIVSSNINKLSIVTDDINKLDNELSITSETLNNDTQIINNLSKMINNYIIEKPIDVKLENKEYIKKDEDIPVTKVIDNITNTLDINNLNSITENKKKIRIKKQPILINRLLNNNVRLKNLQKYVKNNKNLNEKIDNLKNKMSILQFNSLIEKENNNELLNEVIKTIDNKLYNINNVLENNYNQNGGTASQYYYKYLKYKIKYLELVSSI